MHGSLKKGRAGAAAFYYDIVVNKHCKGNLK